MQKPTTIGMLLAIGLCSGLISSQLSANARPIRGNAKVKTAAQAANIARFFYVNRKGKPEKLLNWRNPTVTRRKSKQGNLLWDVLFCVPDRKFDCDFAITVAPDGKIVGLTTFAG